MKGLTLIEILIVVIIGALLTALVVPDLLIPHERRLALEARTFLMEVRLVQINFKDRLNLAAWLDVTSYEYNGKPDKGWIMLGLKPLPHNAPFSYTCKAIFGVCTATRLGTADNSKFRGTITINLNSGHFDCGAPYTVVNGNGADVMCG